MVKITFDGGIEVKDLPRVIRLYIYLSMSLMAMLYLLFIFSMITNDTGLIILSILLVAIESFAFIRGTTFLYSKKGIKTFQNQTEEYNEMLGLK